VSSSAAGQLCSRAKASPRVGASHAPTALWRQLEVLRRHGRAQAAEDTEWRSRKCVCDDPLAEAPSSGLAAMTLKNAGSVNDLAAKIARLTDGTSVKEALISDFGNAAGAWDRSDHRSAQRP